MNVDRRDFLRTSAFAAISVGVAGCYDDTSERVSPPPAGATDLPPILFITRDPVASDYRPAVDFSTEQVVFERTPFPNPEGKLDTVLFIVRGLNSGSPSVSKLLPPPPANPSADYPYSQTRPDWSWTARRIYPIWTSDGKELVVFDGSGDVVKGGPTTALIRPDDGSVVNPNLNGKDANGTPVYGGFAAPKPGGDPAQVQIAYAGQPAIGNWGTGGATPEYNQDQNYVFLGTLRTGAYTSAPLETGASITTYQPAHQGRAPYWSPDGNYIVFESSRAGGYALYLVNVAKGTPPQQLTDATYWAQHGKFFPSGRKIVFTALQQPNAAGEGPRGIATIDIGDFL